MGETKIYLDHAATTFLRKEAFEEMLPFLKEQYGNPSSMYSLAREARQAVNTARERTASALGAEEEEIYFTSGGTEANNIAIQGFMKSLGRKGHIIASAVEHHAVMDVCEELAREGHRVTYLPVDKYGRVNPEDLKQAIEEDTALISVMTANNEVGTIQPVKEIGAFAREKGIVFHTDAVQAVGHIPLDVKEINADLLSFSAHKFNGPKGVGGLYVRQGLKVTPLFRGGAQEKKIRPGTENVPGIVGMGKAIELSTGELPGKMDKFTELRDFFIEGLLAMEGVILNGHPTQRLPGNINVCFTDIEGESILLSLDLEGIAASSGSACSSGTLDPSHVLMAMGLDHQTAHGSVRFSLGEGNTREEIEYVLEKLKPIVARLREMSAVNSRSR